MTEPVVFRYFDCRGRAQAIRDVLADAAIPFTDERIAISPAWRTLKEQPPGGPFGSLPVLAWGGDVVAQTLPIAAYLARRLGQYDGLDAMGVARLEMIASVAYLDVTCEVTTLLWVPPTLPDAEIAPRYAQHAARMLHKIDRLDRALAAAETPFFGGERPAVADFFVAEALGMARTVLGPHVEAAVAKAPVLSAITEALGRRPAFAAHLAGGGRPARLSGTADEAASLSRIARWAEGGG